MYHFETIEHIELGELTCCVNEAFSDYSLPIKFTEDEFSLFLQMSGVEKSLSFAAVENNKVIGFILNSSAIYQGKKVVFDVATGIEPLSRGKKTFSKLFDYCCGELAKKEVKYYYLEVLQNNTKAINIYSSKGFKTVREYSVLKYQGKKLCDKNNKKHEEIALKNFDTNTVQNFISPIPSYEHCTDIRNKNKDKFKVCFIKNEKEINAYAIMTLQGQIMEMGYEKIEDLKVLISSLKTQHKTISAKNIDTTHSETINMLLSLDFKETASQFEMKKAL